MKPGVIIAAVLAIGLAALVFMNIKEPTPAPTAAAPIAQAPELKTVNIYIAAQPIPVGTVVTQEMLTVQPWPENLVLESFVKSDGGVKDAVGFVTRSAFQQNEPIIKSKLANKSDPNFLAGELPKGMRVISIITNETEGVAGFLFPGDRVDVILTHEVEYKETGVDPMTATPMQQSRKDSVTETLLTNVKVLAVDQSASGAKSTDGEGKLLIPRSVSLMVSPTDAQRLRLGQKVGTITLALRSLEDRDSADPLTITQETDVSQFKKPETGNLNLPDGEVKVVRGAPSATSGTSPFAAMMESITKSAGAAKTSNATPSSPSNQSYVGQ